MVPREEPEVLVVGAGPVGLLTALLLRTRGVRVEIVDQDRRTSQQSYALALHSRTLSLLDEVGLTPSLVERGRVLPRMAFYEGPERRAAIEFSSLRGEHPYLLVLRQSVLERAMEEALGLLRVKVEWNHRLQSLHDDGDRTVAVIAKLDQVAQGYPVQRTEWVIAKSFERRPKFVVGADGYDSAVRRMSEIETAALGGRMILSVFEIEAEGELPEEARVQLDPDSTSVYWPLEPGRCRWGFEIHAAAEHEPSIARLEHLLAARAPWFKAKPTVIYWSTMALFEQRLAERFGKGNRWLAGDSAHLAPSMGVHSMNVGLREAQELATKIAGVLRGGDSRSSLEQYDAARRAEWRLLFDDTGVQPLPEADPWVRDNRSRILACVPASGDDLELLLRQIGLSTLARRT